MPNTTQPTSQYLSTRNWYLYGLIAFLSIILTIPLVLIMPSGGWTNIFGRLIYSAISGLFVWSLNWLLPATALKNVDPDDYAPKSGWISIANAPMIAVAAGVTFFCFSGFIHQYTDPYNPVTSDDIRMAAGCSVIFAAGFIGFCAAASVGAPRVRDVNAPAQHVGGLRGNEKFLRGARVAPAPAELKLNPGQLHIGNVPLAWETEVQHQLISGMNGTGKTQIINQQLVKIREREKDKTRKVPRAFIIDNAAGFYSRFAQPGDIIINPFDSRSVRWSPFAEIKRPQDYERIAAAFIPLAEGEGRSWSEFARTIFADTMKAMVAHGDRSPRKLFRLLNGPAEIVTEYMEDVGIYGISGKENMRMFSNAKATMAPFIKVLEFLHDEADFSIRDWIRKGDGKPGWCFVTYRDDQMKFLRQFVCAVADLALVESLSLSTNEGLPVSEQRRLFFILDELDSLGVVGELKDLLSKVRKYGGCCLLSIQVVSQMYSTFGRDTTRTILGNIYTRTVLRPADGETAEEMQKLLGEQEVERRTTVQSFSQGTGIQHPSANTSTASTTDQITVEKRPVILASQLQQLPNLEGILMRPGAPHHLIKIQYRDYPVVNMPFLETDEGSI